jgi:protein-arginine kinase activator protein McsA
MSAILSLTQQSIHLHNHEQSATLDQRIINLKSAIVIALRRDDKEQLAVLKQQFLALKQEALG